MQLTRNSVALGAQIRGVNMLLRITLGKMTTHVSATPSAPRHRERGSRLEIMNDGFRPIADIRSPRHTKQMRALTALLPFLVMTGCAHASDPESRLIARIENRIQLPKGAAPINEYRRHYAWSDTGKIVYAVYSRGGRPDSLWLPLEEMPIYLHGGCNVVSFDFDVVSGCVREMSCY